MLDYLRIMLNARLAKMDERGASAVEYGLLIAGIAALIVVVVFAFGGVIKNIFQTTCKSVGQSAAAAAADLLISTTQDEAADPSGPRPLHSRADSVAPDSHLGLVLLASPVQCVRSIRSTRPQDTDLHTGAVRPAA